ncbi:uncharacterized protein LOC133825609 [Humulus lupulus]|uniref:uncharacterized protein LOC133825609 n=1 Tax=Humulus lupulus TaxID=3486 RepID=UPI002B40CBC3|nr:uncharacterized protein LOC133825609 [Humulus lupulus]
MAAKGSFSSSSGVHNRGRNRDEFDCVSCDCGLQSVVRTSWTKQNPGRRFRTCSRVKSDGGCDFFRWVDSESSSSQRGMVPGWVRSFEAEDGKHVKNDVACNISKKAIA